MTRNDSIEPRRRTSRTAIDPLLGMTIGQDLLIERAIGTGSHADVFLARQRSVGDRKVALKVLGRPYLQLREADFRRAAHALLREASLLGQMHAPCFVSVHWTSALPDGRPYVVLEYVEGDTVAARIQGKAAIPFDVALDICMQLASGLEELHEAGYVHRDVTPANVIVGTGPLGDVAIKMIDFGTVTRVSERADRFRVGYDLEHPLGTIAYMAPEQARGDVVDGRADQFALASVLFEMLVGHRASDINAPTQRAMLEFLRSDAALPATPWKTESDVPAAIGAVVLRALSRQPDARYASVRAFADALRDAATGARPRGRERSLLGRLLGERGPR